MRVIKVKSSIKGKLEPTSFLLGYVGEKKSTTLSFNIEKIAEEFPDNTLTYTLSFLQERQEGEKRIILFSGRFAIGGLIDYDIETTALLEAGAVFLQLGAYTLGDERIWLSEKLPMRVEESIEGATPPEDLPASWYEDLVTAAGEIGQRIQEANELAPEMEENAAKAKESELAAKESEENAHEWALVAEQGIRVASFEVNDDGDLIQYMPDNGGSNLVFTLNSNGELEVMING